MKPATFHSPTSTPSSSILKTWESEMQNQGTCTRGGNHLVKKWLNNKTYSMIDLNYDPYYRTYTTHFSILLMRRSLIASDFSKFA